jgi:hypothetical protein
MIVLMSNSGPTASAQPMSRCPSKSQPFVSVHALHFPPMTMPIRVLVLASEKVLMSKNSEGEGMGLLTEAAESR